MQHLAPIIRDLAVILAVAGLVTILFQRIKQPIVLGYIAAGIIVGPHSGPLIFVKDTENLQTLAELGVIFLMFSLGLEFSFRKLTRVGFSAAVTGLLEVVLMLLMGFAAGKLMGWSFFDSLFLGAAIAISSTTIIVKALDELKLKKKRFAELIFGVLIVEDLLAILLLALLTTIVVTKSFFSMTMVSASLKLILVVGGWFIIGYFLVPSWMNRLSKVISNETLTVVSIALCLGLVTLAAKFEYSVALGAFIMGSILAETAQSKLIERLIEPVRDIFGAVFFVSVGMLIDPMMIIRNWHEVLFLVFVVLIGKIFTSAFGALLTGQNLETSVRVGFSMAQIGEFSFIIAALGLALGVTSSQLYPIIVAVSAITTFLTPYCIRYAGNISFKIQNHMPPSIRYLLDGYSGWMYRESHDRSQKAAYRMAMFRIIVNSIVVAIIFILSANYLLPWSETILPRALFSDLVVWCFTLVLSLPFLWGMMFAIRFDGLKNRSSRLTPFYILPSIFALAEISALSFFLFDSWIIGCVLVLVAAGFSYIFYQRLERSYRWFERRLITNMSGSMDSAKKRFYNLAPWDHFLVKVNVDYNSDAAYKKMSELKAREKFGINIVAIQRGDQIILAPRGSQEIYPLDLLLVLGSEEQIDAFRALTERQGHKKSIKIENLEDILLKSFVLKSDSQFIGKSIREAEIREKTQGIVVGLERHGKRVLNPDPATILEAGDVVLLVGNSESLEKVFNQ